MTTKIVQVTHARPTRVEAARAAGGKPHPTHPRTRGLARAQAQAGPTTPKAPRAPRRWPVDGKTAAECFYPMPTLAEVIGRGFPASKLDEIRAERDELIRRFDTDPVFRAEVIAQVEAHEKNQRAAAEFPGA